MHRSLLLLATLASQLLACSDCSGAHDVTLTRNVKRMQPGSLSATTDPRSQLEWGDVNFLHTTDTHGWLEGHLKEQNYGADWGDFVSFTKRMREKAASYGVDLLLVDTGDLHDGAGLSDATSPNGNLSNPVFENIDYDLLSIGNHELYVTDVAYETFGQFAKVYGDRYLTSNVQILNPSTSEFEYIGQKYRFFKTAHGVSIMAFGVLYDFTGNSNVSKVIHAADLIQEAWFQEAVMTKGIDMFVLIGHNPARPTVYGSTFGTIQSYIRKMRPQIPIQIFGGHTHIRDFVVYDSSSTALESGRYCETLGWLAMSGVRPGKYSALPSGVATVSRPAIATATASTSSAAVATATISGGSWNSTRRLKYARRYLDWNRLTFEYHASGSQNTTFDTTQGKGVTSKITSLRNQLNLTSLYGCAPRTWCASCVPFGERGNIYRVLSRALAATVINSTRSTVPRLIILNTGSVRFDLVKGPFTYDDSFIVSPFSDAFQFLPNVPYKYASQVLGILNAGAFEKKRRDLSSSDFNFTPMTVGTEECVDPSSNHAALQARGERLGRVIRRQSTSTKTPGYTTTDDFGTDGDDTIHSPIPYYPQPNNFQANASLPQDGSDPKTVDLIFLDYIASDVVAALAKAGVTYSEAQVTPYLPTTFTTNSYLPAFAKIAPAWQKNVPNCPVGEAIGS